MTPAEQDLLGIFQGQSDVGSVSPPGTAAYDPHIDTYTLMSAGANTWYHVDGFHYLWKKVSGDWTLTADVAFPPRAYAHEPNPHRKGILMFRQTLDAGAAYAALSVHGSGMPALQYRRERGANTEDIELNIDLPKTIRIEKRGDIFTVFLSAGGEPLHQVGASTRLHLKSPFYVGLGALSHNVDTTDQVQFSHVALQRPSAAKNARPVLYSTLQTIQIEDQYRRATVIRSVPKVMQSVNWLPDGKSLYVHEDGHLERIDYLDPPAGAPPQPIAVGKLVDCSGNYGVSPDGRWLAVSCAEKPEGGYQVFVLPAGGGDTVRRLTDGAQSSFFHAWSPDSRIVAFTRGSASKADIFTIPASGGEESRLTRDTVNDGPDFSPDGQFIYFDSSRSGSTQIWRMRPDGSHPEQITDDDGQNSSPHISPDGKNLAFLSQPGNAGSRVGNAALKIMAFSDGLIHTLAVFQGDRGSLAMYSWGDVNHLAFIAYQLF
jgi:dipeptidyl aminopeptidase/acylaminoacyl peptidase